VPDPLFALPQLAAIYDAVDDDRNDLDVYEAIVHELGARTVLDIGCGTGTLACRLALSDLAVVAVDPAAASLDVARRKPGAEKVRWVLGEVSDALPLEVDLAVMTGNVAQVFLTDMDWSRTLAGAAAALRDGGWLVFEVRNPTRRAWEHWTKPETYRELDIDGVGRVDTWSELLDVRLPFITFRHTYRFWRDGTEVTSDSTLRFRTHDEIEAAIGAAGLRLNDVRGAPDRPGLELVFLATKPTA
jgi:SAM-dependent methyltransferase